MLQRGLEPPRAQCPLAPQASVSTNSTTAACVIDRVVIYTIVQLLSIQFYEDWCSYGLFKIWTLREEGFEQIHNSKGPILLNNVVFRRSTKLRTTVLTGRRS